MKKRHIKLTKLTQSIMDYYHFKDIALMLKTGEKIIADMNKLVTEEIDELLIEILLKGDINGLNVKM